MDCRSHACVILFSQPHWFSVTTSSVILWMKIIYDVFLDEYGSFILTFHSWNILNLLSNMLKFLCYERRFLAHGPWLAAHGSFNKVAPLDMYLRNGH